MTIETKMNAPAGASADARLVAAEMLAAFEALFYTTKRVGGGVQNFDAIKVMKFAAADGEL